MLVAKCWLQINKRYHAHKMLKRKKSFKIGMLLDRDSQELCYLGDMLGKYDSQAELDGEK